MISGEYKALSRFERRAARIRSYLLGRTALCGALTIGAAAGLGARDVKAGPQGTVVVGGSVDISRTGTHTEFTQHTQTALLNHSSFDIQQNESVNFAQPNASAIAINRIVGSNLPTEIAGKLTANGNVWVLNPSGVAIHGTAHVNVGGLIATTASISDEDAMAGRARFSGAPAGSAVTNAGAIEAGKGSIVLVAPVVRNTGTITAHGSDVALGAGSGFTVDFEGDGLTRFEVTPGDGVSLTNTGTISARGGAAYISAESADAVQTAVVSIGGTVEATRIEKKGGVIYISGGDHGVTEVSGTLETSQAEGDGGTVVVTGEKVDLKSTAVVDASGAADGGTVLIGGDLHGAPIASEVLAQAGAPETAPLPTARRTVVRGGARIAADAGSAGDGGRVVVWSDEGTGFRGAIEARGGATAGDGGSAEVSGKLGLAFDGTVDLSAPAGAAGSLLLDPDDVEIVAGTAADDTDDADAELADNAILAGDGTGTFTISAGALQDSVNLADTTVEAAKTITQNAAVDLSAGAANTLTYRTDTGDIAINDSFIGNGGTFTVDAGGKIAVDGTLSNAGDIVLSAKKDIGISAGIATTAAGTVGLAGSEIDIDSGGSVDVGGNTVTLTNVDGDDSRIGGNEGGGPNGFVISDADISRITAGEIVVDANGGSATLDTLDTTDDPDTAKDITVRALDVDIAHQVDIGDSTLALVNISDTSVLLGSTGEGGFVLTDTALGRIEAGAVTIDSGGFDVALVSVDTLDEDLTIDAGEGSVTYEGASSGLGDFTVASALEFDAVGVGNSLDVGSNDVNITTSGAGSIEVQSLTAGTATLNPGGNVFFGGANTVTGSVTVDAGSRDVDLRDFFPGVGATVAVGPASALDFGSLELVTNGGAMTVNGVSLPDVGTLELTSGGGAVSVLGLTGDNLAVNAGAGAVAFNDAASSLDNLTVATSGSITQNTAGTLTVAGEASLTSTGAVSLSAANDFSTVNASGTDVALNDVNAIGLGEISATGGLAVAAGGAITDTEDRRIEVRGATSLLATDGATGRSDIVLDNSGSGDTHDFDSDRSGDALSFDAADVTLADASRLTLGVSSASSLDATAIDFDIAGPVTVGGGTGTATFHAPAFGFSDSTPFPGGNAFAVAFTSTDAANLDTGKAVFADTGGFSSPIMLADFDSGTAIGDVVVDSTGDIDIGFVGSASLASIFRGSLTLDAGGDIRTRSDVALGVAGKTTIGADVASLDNARNDFAGLVEIAAGSAVLADANDITLGDVDVAGDLGVTAGGSILENGDGATAGADVDVGGLASLAAGADVVMTDALNDFGTVDARGANVTLNDADGVALGQVAASGALAVTAGGEITDTAGKRIEVTGSTSLLATDGGTGRSDIVLDNASHDFDEDISGDAVAFDGKNVTIRDADRLTLGTSNASGTLTLTAADFDLAGTVTADGGNGAAVLNSSRFALSDTFGDSSKDADGHGFIVQFTSLDAANLEAGRTSFRIDDSVADPISYFLTSDAVPIAVMNFDSGTALGNVTLQTAGTDEDIGFGSALAGVFGAQAVFRQDLSLIATDDILHREFASLGVRLTVVGTTSIGADAATVDRPDNDFQGAVDIAATSAMLVDANDITLGDVDVVDNLAVTAGGSIIEDGDGAAAGNDVDVGGLASLAAGADIVMTDALNDFGTVDASGANVTLNDADGIALGQVTASGDLVVTAGGTITDTAGKRIAVAGSTDILAKKGGDFFDIVLDNSGPGDVHDFAGTDDGVIQHPFSAVGEDIAVNDVDAMLVGDIETHAGDAAVDPTIAGNDGSLTAHTGGALSVSTLTPVTVDIAGDASLTAESFTTPGEFADIVIVSSGQVTVGGAFSASGEDVVLRNSAVAPQEIGTVVAHDDGVPDPAAQIGFGTTGTPVAGSFALISAAGANDGTAGTITANGLSLVGSEAATFTFDNAGNAVGQLRVDEADGVTLRNSGALTLDSIGATDPVGNLTVEADGEITQVARIRAVDVDLTAANAARIDFFDITLDATVNSITGTISASGADIALSNAAEGGMTLGDIATHATPGGITVTGDNGDLDIVSTGGAIRDASGTALMVIGTTSLLAADGGDSFDVLLDNVDAHHLAGPINASGEDISIANAAAATTFGTVTTHDDSAGTVDPTIDNGNDGDLTVASTGGAILDTSGRAITVRGTTSLLAAGGGDVFDIRLDGDDADATDRPHDFSASDPFDASGEDILVTDANGIRLGAVTPHDNSGGTADPAIDEGDNGDLTIGAGAAISDTTGSAIVVPGETALVARDSLGNFFDIALDDIATHDFGGAVSAAGEDIVLDDASAIALGAVTSRESGEDDNTVAFFDDNGDGVANAADGVVSAGDLTVRAGGTITDTAAPISVDGRTRLEARDGETLFDITLDTPGTHDFDANAALSGGAAGDAGDEVDAIGATITLLDRNAIALGEIDAGGDLAVTAGGSITDTPGKAIIVNGMAVITAVDDPESPGDFFDIALDNIATHDFNIVTLTGEGIELADADDLAVASVTAHGDSSPDPTLGGANVDLTAGGRLSFTEIAAPQGSITLATGENFEVDAPPGSTPLDASGNIELNAPHGSFFDGGAQALGDGLTFHSAHGNITMIFGHGFVVADKPGTGPFTLDAPTGTSTIEIGTGTGSEFLGFGTAEFLARARLPGFDPFLVTTGAGDADLFHVTGNLSLVSESSLTVRSQNTSPGTGEGKGVVVNKVTLLSGSFAAITIFGSFNESGGNIAALQGFKDGGNFSLDDSNTANACVILLPSSCQPIGTLTPTLDFPDGLLLGIRFVDPRQDLDDPFTNRGDEEEWE